MPEQLILPGVEPGGPQPPRQRAQSAPRRPRKAFNLFFAIRPTPEDARRLAALGDSLAVAQGLQCQPLPAERLHVSLHNLGEYDAVPPGLVRLASAVADGLAFAAFEVVFDQALVFRSRGSPMCCAVGAEWTRCGNFGWHWAWRWQTPTCRCCAVSRRI